MKAKVLVVESRRLPGFSATKMPIPSPMVMPITDDVMPRRSVFIIESLKSGHTSRLPLMLRGQSPVMKPPSHCT